MKKFGVVPQSGDGQFFTAVGKDAVALGLAQAIASSRDELKTRYSLEGDLPTLEPQGALDTTVQILNWPFITGLLLVLGLVGLYIEFTSPGVGFGGLLAAVCFTAFFWSHFLGGTATWLAAALFLLGIAFLAVELFILPGFAVAGLLGAALILAGLLMAMQGFFIPHTSQELTMLAQSMLVVFLAGAAFVVAAVAVSKRMGSLPVFNRLMFPAGSGRRRLVRGCTRRGSAGQMKSLCRGSAWPAWRNRTCGPAARPASAPSPPRRHRRRVSPQGKPHRRRANQRQSSVGVGSERRISSRSK